MNIREYVLEAVIVPKDTTELNKRVDRILSTKADSKRKIKALNLALRKDKARIIGLGTAIDNRHIDPETPKLFKHLVGGDFNQRSKRIRILAPLSRLRAKLFPKGLSYQIRTTLPHELIHREQDKRLVLSVSKKDNKDIDYVKKSVTHKPYLHRPEEQMAYAHDKVRGMINDKVPKEKILSVISKKGIVPKDIAKDIKSKKRYLKYLYQYAHKLR